MTRINREPGSLARPPGAARCARAAVCMVVGVAWGAGARAAGAGLEQIVVTGSRIDRWDTSGPSPVVAIPAAMFQQTGAVSLERTLDLYPQVLATAGATSNDPSNDGQANISLRGLGANRTLVLLDGRRLIPADGTGNVDLNPIPPALVDRVEILTGGGSAVYGSDAIAGVVNVRLRQHFEGVELEGSTSVTDRGDGESHLAGITAGTMFNGGAGSVMAHVGYARRDAIMQDARSFSRFPLQYVEGLAGSLGPGGSFVGSGSSITDAGFNVVFSSQAAFDAVFAGYGFAPGTVVPQAGIGVNRDGTLFTMGTGAPGTVVNYRGDTTDPLFNDRSFAIYNFASETALQMPLERTSAFVRGSYDIGPRLHFYGEALYADYSVERQLASVGAGIVLIPPTNPFIPRDLGVLLASRAMPNAPYRYFGRLTPVGPQSADNERSVLQWTAGIDLQLSDEWSLDAYLQHGSNDRTEQLSSSASLSRIQNLTFAPDGGASICAGGFNPFALGTLSAECAGYLALAAANDVSVRQTIAEASVKGSLLSLPAGKVQIVAGVLHKRDEFDYRADPALSALQPGIPGVIGPRPDVSGFAGAPDRGGEQDNTDVYIEALVPLLRDRRGAESLELGLGYRYSDYSEAGGVDTYKIELAYRPTRPLLLRGSLQHAVRAPSIEELFYPEVPDQFIVPRPDPCDVGSRPRTGPDRAAVEALCLAQGLPAALLPTYRYDLRRVDGVAGGNPELEPEEADTVTVGVVFTTPVAWARSDELRVAVDGYRIEIANGIGRWDSESAVTRCFDPQYNPTYDVANVYCTFFTRDAINGNIFARIIDRNIGGIETAGVDLQADWGFAGGPGHLSISAAGSWVDHFRYLDPSGGRIEYAGTVGGGGLGRTLPRWRSLLTLGYALHSLGVNARWRHLDAASDVDYRDFDVPAADYLDLGVHYASNSGRFAGLSLWAGVDNVFDEAPPVFPTWQQANTDPSVYDVLGRAYYLRLRYEFGR